MPLFGGDNPFKKKGPSTMKVSKKKHKYDSVTAHLKEMLKVDILKGADNVSLRQAVQLKEGVNRDDWIAMNVIEAYNTLLVIYGFLQNECKAETCPTMSAGSNYQYLWANEKDGKTEALSAPVYIEKLFAWVSTQMDDENVFSTSSTYSKNFLPTVKKILSRMFRVYAHIYYQHMNVMQEDAARANLDKCFRIFYYFVDTFKLISEKELLPLQPLIDQLN